jgi:AGCS family alanine or glycine:cation symporter
MIGVFIDTFVVLTMTALIVITSLYTDGGALANGPVDAINKTNMVQISFSSLFGDSVGNLFVAVCLLFFAFSTIISWNLFGKINVNYLFGRKGEVVYSILAVFCVFTGTILDNDLVWDVQDTLNQLMVLPNALALIALSGMVVACCNKYAGKKDDEEK